MKPTIAVCFGALVHYAAAVAPSVTLSDATYVGVYTRMPTATPLVVKWQGVRFADNVERFEPPAAVPASNKLVRLSNAQPPSCIQEFPFPKEKNAVVQYLFNSPPNQESEDCLFLNIYAPANAAPGSLTVMAWILPGAYQFGSGTQAPFDGTSFAANENVVVVTGNHRTNLFGFPGEAPDVPDSARNLGIQDQIFYLQWIQKNIAKFGGDPKKVTIFGESSGAVSVDFLTISQAKNPPFRAAIMESGQALISPASAFNWNVLQPQLTPGKPWQALARLLGCYGDSSAIYQCIKQADAFKVRDILTKNSIAFPIPVVDNKTIFKDSYERRQQGRIANVPILVGSNLQEGNLFLGIAVASYTSFTDPGYLIGNLPIIGGLIPDSWKSDSARRGFSTSNFGLLTTAPFKVASRLLTDAAFNCPAQQTANASAYAGYKTWRYLYSGDFANAQRNLPYLGVGHATEVALVWNTYDYLPSPPTTQELAVSKFIQGAWARFAKDPENGPGWREYGTTPGRQIVAELARDNQPTYREFYPVENDKNCAVIGPLDRVLSSLELPKF